MLKSEDVAAYLRQHPTFFNEHMDLFEQLEIGGNQQPFHQRQLEVMRERHQVQSTKYEMVVESARSNQALDQLLHELAKKLLSAGIPNVETVMETVRTQFSLEHVRIWQRKLEQSEDPGNVDFAALAQRVIHGGSVCDDRVSSQLLLSLFGEEHGISSCAFIPLLAESENIGVMVLGANDPERFQPGMGAIYLDRMGQLIGAFLSG